MSERGGEEDAEQENNWAQLRRGDLIAAEADACALLDVPSLSDQLLPRSLATSVLANVLVERGDLDGAEQTLKPLAVFFARSAWTAPVLRHTRGRLRFAQGRFADALGDFRTAGEIAVGGLAISPSYLPWRSDAALAALTLGEPDTAQRLSGEELELARAFGAPHTLGVALRSAGLVAGRQGGEELLRQAIEVLAGHFHCLTDIHPAGHTHHPILQLLRNLRWEGWLSAPDIDSILPNVGDSTNQAARVFAEWCDPVFHGR